MPTENEMAEAVVEGLADRCLCSGAIAAWPTGDPYVWTCGSCQNTVDIRHQRHFTNCDPRDHVEGPWK